MLWSPCLAMASLPSLAFLAFLARRALAPSASSVSLADDVDLVRHRHVCAVMPGPPVVVPQTLVSGSQFLYDIIGAAAAAIYAMSGQLHTDVGIRVYERRTKHRVVVRFDLTVRGDGKDAEEAKITTVYGDDGQLLTDCHDYLIGLQRTGRDGSVTLLFEGILDALGHDRILFEIPNNQSDLDPPVSPGAPCG
jgi:hypothetical protein